MHNFENRIVSISKYFSPLFCKEDARFSKKTEAKSKRKIQNKIKEEALEKKCDKHSGLIRALQEFSKDGICEELVRLQKFGLLELHPYFSLAFNLASNISREERLKELEKNIDDIEHNPNGGLSRWKHCLCTKTQQVLCRKLRIITSP